MLRHRKGPKRMSERMQRRKAAQKKAKNTAKEANQKAADIVKLSDALDTLLRISTGTIPQRTVAEEVFNEKATDEVADIFSGARTPKVLITSDEKVSLRTKDFCEQLADVIPNACYIPQVLGATFQVFVREAIETEVTALLFINENAEEPNALMLSHLPNGPTANFVIRNIRLKSGSALTSDEVEKDVPKVEAEGFKTPLGLRVGRLLIGLFPAKESRTMEAHQRGVIFHNQRDSIFFRHYRKEMKPGDSMDESRLVKWKIGPQFTMKLVSILRGVFDR